MVMHANPLLHLFGYRLIVRGLKWSRIDLRQKVARLDILALAESNWLLSLPTCSGRKPS
jgi:hypothetical protein